MSIALETDDDENPPGTIGSDTLPGSEDTLTMAATSNKPTPDPTVLTTQQLRHDTANVKEQLNTRIDGIKEIFEVRLHCTEETVQHLQSNVDKREEVIDGKIDQFKELQDEKFDSIDKQFLERDTRTDKIAELNQKALDAALKAATEAVEKQNTSNNLAIAKSEASTTKQIDSININIESQAKSHNEKLEQIQALNQVQINALKDSMSNLKNTQILGEGRAKGSGEVIAWIFSAVLLLTTMIASFVAAANWIKAD